MRDFILSAESQETHNRDANYWIRKLEMNAHPEGGWYKETFRDERLVDGKKNASTAIYFLIEGDSPSHFHRISSTEMWHFYYGDPLIVHELSSESKHYKQHKIGKNLDNGEEFQAFIPSGAWFAAETKGNYSLVGCTVAPGFEFEDFELAEGESLCQLFPKHRELIQRLTY